MRAMQIAREIVVWGLLIILGAPAAVCVVVAIGLPVIAFWILVARSFSSVLGL